MHKTLAVVFAAACSIGSGICLAGREPALPAVETPPDAERCDTRPAAEATSALGVELYKRLAASNPDRNVFVSPYSIAIALAMVAEGARGETEAEMIRVLGVPGVSDPAGRAITPVHFAFAGLAAQLDEAAGVVDDATRKRVAELRAQLDEANAQVEAYNRDGNVASARTRAEEAAGYAGQLNRLYAEMDRFDLRVANAVWVDRAFNLVPAYVDTTSRFYGTGGASLVDFGMNPEGARATINQWVEKRTQGGIKDLLPPGSVTPDLRLVITNAVYFKGQWQTPFAKAATRDEDFTLAGGGTTRVRMMYDPRRAASYAAFSGDGSFFETPTHVPRTEADRPPCYPDDAGMTMLELPYKGAEPSRLSMVVILPRSKDGLAEIERNLTSARLAEWTARLGSRTVETALPKFTMGYDADVRGVLEALGIRRAFVMPGPGVAGAAEFPGISDGASPSQQVCLSRVLHKAWIDVNETGTEAAAATAALVNPSAKIPRDEMVPFTPVFRADHPFLFVIRDRVSGAVLFMGRVASPTQPN